MSINSTANCKSRYFVQQLFSLVIFTTKKVCDVASVPLLPGFVSASDTSKHSHHALQDVELPTALFTYIYLQNIISMDEFVEYKIMGHTLPVVYIDMCILFTKLYVTQAKLQAFFWLYFP